MIAPISNLRNILLTFLIAAAAGSAMAQVPSTIAFQGLMTNESGVPLPSGDYSITFRVYDVDNEGAALWAEVQSVKVLDGIANALLGRINPLTLPFDDQYWLGMTIGQNPTELKPRIPMSAVAYSLNARTVDDDAISEDKIADGAVARAKIAPDAINETKIADNAIHAAKIQTGAVTTEKINTEGASEGQTLVFTNGSMTWGAPSGEGVISEVEAGSGLDGGGTVGTVTLDIADDGVTSRMIAADAVGTDQIADAAITLTKVPVGELTLDRLNLTSATTDDIIVFNGTTAAWQAQTLADGSVQTQTLADGAVTGPKVSATGAVASDVLTFDGTDVVWSSPGGIGPGTVGTTELADDAVTTIKLIDGAVTTTKIGDGAVGTANIAASAVSATELADGTVGLSKIDVSEGTNKQVLTILGNAATWTAADGVEPGGIGETELADNSVSVAKIKTAAVTAGKLGSQAVGNAALADGAVTNTKISPATIDPLNKLDLSGATNGQFLVFNGGALTWTNTVPGDLNITGTLSKGGGTFKIDHPLAPTEKYLYHSFVESDDMMNIYSGNADLDADGRAIVTLPDWLEPVNKDYRYQLTCIGGYAPVYVEQEIQDGEFIIAGGTPELRVSWQITAVRDDAWARQNRVEVEVDKPVSERGTYYHPESSQ